MIDIKRDKENTFVNGKGIHIELTWRGKVINVVEALSFTFDNKKIEGAFVLLNEDRPMPLFFHLKVVVYGDEYTEKFLLRNCELVSRSEASDKILLFKTKTITKVQRAAI